MKFGYVRTFGDEPVEAQRRALRDVGAEAIFVDADIAPGTVFKVNFEAMLRQAKPGDEIVVTRLDRLAKRTGALFIELQKIKAFGLLFRSLDDGIATDPGGAFYAHIRALSAFAETFWPQAAVWDDSPMPLHRKGGQQPLISEKRWQELLALLKAPEPVPVLEVAKMAGVSREAIYKRLRAAKQKDVGGEANDLD
jgi:DNA invertase Pin-like site-specific DNA recombinase